MRPRTVCTHPGCEREHKAFGYCLAHYRRKTRGVDMNTPIRLWRVKPSHVAKVRELIPGKTYAQVAEIMGLSRSGVAKICKANNIEPGIKRGERGERIPSWVPDELIEGFKRRYRTEGEIAAASWARVEKRRIIAWSTLL